MILKKILPGIFFVFIISSFAWILGQKVPIIGGAVFGIFFGMMIAFLKRPNLFGEGIKFTSKKILQISIILLGFEMNLFQVLSVGRQSLILIFATLTAAFVTALIAGRYLKMSGNIKILIGVGTSICGGSAIAATAPIISADDKEVAFSISTIFLFNVLAIFIFPFAGHLLSMGDTGFGMWAGTAINDTSSVVAAGYSYSDKAGSFAVIVKLTRTLMIIPISFLLAFFIGNKRSVDNTDSKVNFVKIFPWFILGFLIASIIATLNFVPKSIATELTHIGKFFIVMAMTAIGLNTHFKHFIKDGGKPILLGLLCWISVAIVSLVVQRYLNLW